jgi:hypothetical protein
MRLIFLISSILITLESLPLCDYTAIGHNPYSVIEVVFVVLVAVIFEIFNFKYEFADTLDLAMVDLFFSKIDTSKSPNYLTWQQCYREKRLSKKMRPTSLWPKRPATILFLTPSKLTQPKRNCVC